MNSLSNQLGWCITTKDYLNNLNSEMRFVANQYTSMANDLGSSGFIAEMLPMIDSMSQEFNQDVNQIIKYVEDEHLAYVQKQSVAIQDVINKLLVL